MLNSDAMTFDLKQFQTQKWRPNSSLNGALPLVASMKGNKSPCLSIESALGSHDGLVALLIFLCRVLAVSIYSFIHTYITGARCKYLIPS